MSRKNRNNKPQRRSAVDPSAILKLLQAKKHPLSRSDIMFGLGLKKRDKHELREALDRLLSEGKVVRIRRAYGLTDRMNLVTGRLEMHKNGVSFVIPDDTRRQDIFVGQRQLGGAWHGDRVAVAIIRENTDKNNEGRVVRILERGTQILPSRVLKHLGERTFLCSPTDPRLEFGILAEAPEDMGRIPVGEIVLCAPGEQLENNFWEAEIVERLGPEDDPAVQEAVTKANNHVPTEFPDDALAQADELPTVPDEKDFAGREDLRDLGFVTIDGATARDFDDAIFVERDGKGWKLWVAIADVSHYVRPGTPLDREARERGNSYYFPLSVEPMFPEKLSNGLCSLNPEEPRLAMGTRIRFNSRGEPVDAEFFKAVICSKARLTYNQVFRGVMQGVEEDRQSMTPAVLSMLQESEKLARLLNKNRSKRGSIDFDLPEPEILFDMDGATEDIRPRARNFAHQLIEEFMIAANEAVASFLEENGPACLYRIHPEPDAEKLQNLFRLLGTTMGEDTPDGEAVSPKAIQQLLKDMEGTEKEFLVNRLLLRSMMQAKYSPENEGHFGLASESYCHFTSPIRRYADLVVHRLLKSALGETAHGGDSAKNLSELGGHLSTRERRAMTAEREILKRLTMLFLRDRLGEEYTGVISSLRDYGFWVELGEVLADGLVRLSSLSDDYYAYWPHKEMIVGERTGRTFRLGERVEVVLEDVSIERLEAHFTLKGDPPASSRKRAGAGKGPRRSTKSVAPARRKPGRKAPDREQGGDGDASGGKKRAPYKGKRRRRS